MPVIVRMAFRNLWEHKAKSLIVGSFLALGVFVLIVGNAFLDASQEGVRKSFIANYTGDVFISGKTASDISLFGVSSMDGMEATPLVRDFEKVLAYAKGLKGVAMSTSMATGMGGLQIDENAEGNREESDDNADSSFLYLFGVDSSSYWKMFDGIDVVQGRLLEPGDTGIMLPEDRLEKMGKYLMKKVVVGEKVVIFGYSGSGMKIRELTLVGTYRARSEGTVPEQLAYVDVDSCRILSGMTVGAAENIDLDATQTGMLAATDTDALFGDDMIDETAPAASARVTEDSLSGILGDTSERERLNRVDYGAWHFILLRAERPEQAKALIADLNAWFAREGIEAMAGDWKKAAGFYAQSVDMLRVVFTVAIVILAVVTVIIIMNTLVISVIERTGEIGTMRAIGASRGFVRKLFATETLVLSVVFGLVGMAISFAAVWILKAANIKAENEMLRVLFGGNVMSPLLSLGPVLASLGLIVAVGYLAHFYPVSVALKIQPVRAMQNE